MNRANKTLGLICFSQSFKSPVQWAHYGDSHRCICLGFDVPDEKLIKVDYVDYRTPEEEFKWSLELKGIEYVEYMLSKKYKHWQYEQEVRMLVNFPKKIIDNSLVFSDYSDDLILREVILGARSSVSIKKMRGKLANEFQSVDVKKVSMSRTAYEMDVLNEFE